MPAGGKGQFALSLVSSGYTNTDLDVSTTCAQTSGVWLAGDLGNLKAGIISSALVIWQFVLDEHPVSIPFIFADGTELPLFHLVESSQQTVREMLRILRPGGIFLHCENEREPSRPENVIEARCTLLRDLVMLMPLHTGRAEKLARLDTKREIWSHITVFPFSPFLNWSAL
jgi:SAM-dependent methyltransferase